MSKRKRFSVEVHIEVEANDPDDAYQVVMGYLDPIHESEHTIGEHPGPFEYEIFEEAATEVRPPCPECGTTIDEDGYCTDVGCVNCGKTVAV